MGVTLEDIAAEAGLAVSTVSRVLSGKDNISPLTALKVRRAVRKLGYFSKGNVYQSKIQHKLLVVYTQNVGTLLGKDPYFMELFSSLEACAESEGHLISIKSLEPKGGNGEILKSLIRAHDIEGVILLGYVEPCYIETLLKTGVALVSLEAPCDHPYVSSVIADAIGGVSFAVEYLVSLGHKRIAMPVTDAPYDSIMHIRYGYMRGLEKAGIEYDPKLLFRFSEDKKYEIADSILDFALTSPSRPTAIIVCEDMIAHEICKIASRKGVNIPSDLSLVSFGDTLINEKCVPQLTSIWVDVPHMIKKTFEILLEQIEFGRRVREIISVPTHLVVRESVAPVIQ